MIDRSIWRFLRRIGLAMLLISTLPVAIASAQFRGGDNPFAEHTPLKVMIMLGPDYDYSEPPFLDANTVVEYFSSPEDGAFVPPRFVDVDVDLENPIPDEHHVTVIAAVFPEMDEAERQKFKKKIQRISVRYGINHVELISREPAANEGSLEEAVWLRLPYMQTDIMKAHFSKYAKIAVALSKSADSSSGQPRIDVYELPIREGGDPSNRYVASPPYTLNDPFASSDPFGSSPTASAEPVERTPLSYVDPFARENVPAYAFQRNSGLSDDNGGSQQSPSPFDDSAPADPFGDPSPQIGQSDPFATTQPPKLSDDAIKNRIVRQQKLLLQIEQKALALVQSEQSVDRLSELLTLYAEADYKTRTELQELELRVLETKLEKIRDEIQKRESVDVKQAIIRERVRSMMHGRDE